MINWGTFWEIILGDMPVENFLAYVALMSAGALIFFTLDVSHAVRRDDSTPRKFNWGFMIRDNVFRGAGVLFVIMGTVIFYDSFFGVEINAKLAFTQGLGIDALIGVILKRGKQSGPLKKTRDKLMKKYQ